MLKMPPLGVSDGMKRGTRRGHLVGPSHHPTVSALCMGCRAMVGSVFDYLKKTVMGGLSRTVLDNNSTLVVLTLECPRTFTSGFCTSLKET